MKSRSNFLAILAVMAFFSACTLTQDSKIYKIHFDAPASDNEEALVIGNGTMGAMVCGGLGIDTVSLNDTTMWSFETLDASMNLETYKQIPKIREALLEDEANADILNAYLQGVFSQDFAPLGRLLLDFGHAEKSSAYYRELNISDAEARVEYRHEDVNYYREYFVSKPDNLMLMKLGSDKEGALNFALSFSSLLEHEVYVDGTSITVSCYAPCNSESSCWTKFIDNELNDAELGVKFTTIIELRECDGHIASSDSGMIVSGASDAVLAVSIATSFNGYDKNPATEGKNSLALANRKLMKASSKTYDELKMRHQEDYHSLFDEVE